MWCGLTRVLALCSKLCTVGFALTNVTVVVDLDIESLFGLLHSIFRLLLFKKGGTCFLWGWQNVQHNTGTRPSKVIHCIKSDTLISLFFYAVCLILLHCMRFDIKCYSFILFIMTAQIKWTWCNDTNILLFFKFSNKYWFCEMK